MDRHSTVNNFLLNMLLLSYWVGREVSHHKLLCIDVGFELLCLLQSLFDINGNNTPVLLVRKRVEAINFLPIYFWASIVRRADWINDST